MYNSGYSTAVKRRGCTADTRQKVQKDIQDWIQDSNGAKVYWMNGMAGTGKTTIAYSVCEWLEANKLLGASFFCSRASSSCRNVNFIMPTIAYQLALASPSFRLALCKVLESNPSISKQNVVQQFENLIREPLRAHEDIRIGNLIVVIDALDECGDDYGVRLVLGTLLKLGANLPLKFLITSRPEPVIQERMHRPTGYSPAVLHLHDIEQSVVEEDIKKYLNEALSDMPLPPTSEQIEGLAILSGKLFIYAATAVRYITSGGGHSMARLNPMLTPKPKQAVNRPAGKRYKELDELYTAVLAHALDNEKFEAEEAGSMQMVLWTVICAKEPMAVSTLALFLRLAEVQVVAALDPLYSVLHVSDDRKHISTLHASFPDYMFDQNRSKIYHCDQRKHDTILSIRCFDVMKAQLKFNICNLESSFTFDKDVPDLEQKVGTCISPGLFYACRYWGDHLQLAYMSSPDELYNPLNEFLNTRMLFWVEVMNLKQCIVHGISVLAQAESWLSGINSNSDCRKLVIDARDFVARFAAGACSRSTPHIYVSALPFCARTSSVYKQYSNKTHGLTCVHGTAISQRDRAAQATWKTSAKILSIAFSQDGTRIVSGSDDAKIRLWDIRTGGVVAGPFEGHTRSVNSVAFSPDSTCVASGSADRTLRVWNARTGDIIAGPLEGHDSSVWSVSFSPDGTRIVSGSNDRTIRVWEALTGAVAAGPFEGHTDWIRPVAFSPDGTRIVSGSDDQKILVWDAYTGGIIAGPFKECAGYVASVAFSPNGAHIVSGSSNGKIRIWHAHTGDVIAGPFEGHTKGISCVAFSHDGARVISGSNDETIWLWNSQTGHSIAGPFIGHTSTVRSAAFSPDAARIVSGSDDGTIRVWDAYASEGNAGQYKPLEAGHSHFITTVAYSLDVGSVVTFSADGGRIASGSDDETILVWDARTGSVVAGPFKGHSDGVRSVAFSPDGTRIVSGSNDRTIRVWEARTGVVTAGPLHGHGSYVRSVAFTPDGTRIISGAEDKTIRVWDLHSGNVAAGPFKGQAAYAGPVSSPNDIRNLSGFGGTTIRVWDAPIGGVVDAQLERHIVSVNSVVFSLDGTLVVSGSEDKTVLVWDALTGRIITGPFNGHTGPVNSVAFSPDSNSVVSGSNDQSIRVSSVYPLPTNPELYHQLLRHRAISCRDHRHNSESDPGSNVNLGDPPINPTSNSPELTRVLDFEYHDDGWVTSGGIPLLWTPPDLRNHIPYPQDRVVIGYQGSLSIDYRHARFGEKWTECYNST